MGIMNKMKTVAINQLTWGYWEPTKKFYANLVGPEAVPNTLNLACDGYTAQRGGTSGTSLIDKGIGIHNNGLSIYIRNDSFNGNLSAFLASEGDKIIAYETIDSVEEKIVSPRFITLKLDDMAWQVRATGARMKLYSAQYGDSLPSYPTYGGDVGRYPMPIMTATDYPVTHVIGAWDELVPPDNFEKQTTLYFKAHRIIYVIDSSTPKGYITLAVNETQTEEII